MGYSIGVIAKSKKSKDNMLAFMNKNLVQLKDLDINNVASWYHTEIVESLSYINKTLAIGMNYSSLSGIPYYYELCLLRFMALRIGRQIKFNEHKVPYIDYDGYEKWIVLLDTVHSNVDKQDQWAVCNEDGFQPYKSPLHEFFDHTNGVMKFIIGFFYGVAILFGDLKKEEKINSIIKMELARLAVMWEMWTDANP